MALHWNLERIKDSDEVCWVVAPEAIPMHGIEAGEKVMNPVTNSLIWATMAVGIGDLSEANAEEFFTRISFYEKLFGPFMYRGTDWPEGQEPNLTAEEIIRHIGLGTNVSYESPTKWKTRMWKHFASDQAKRFTRASEKLDGEKVAAKLSAEDVVA